MRLIDADHLKKWMLARWQERNPRTDRPFKAGEILDQIDREITYDGVTERPKGMWTRITQGAMPELYMCPFCHRTVESYGVEELLSISYPYCHCGADMRGDAY